MIILKITIILMLLFALIPMLVLLYHCIKAWVTVIGAFWYFSPYSSESRKMHYDELRNELRRRKQ